MSRDRPPLQNQLGYLRLLGAGELADRVAKLQGPRDPYKTGWEMPDDWLGDGEVIAHGDHVLPTITPSIGFEPVISDDPLGAFLGSLTLMRERPDARLLPAHGPVTGSAHARVDELIAHHGTRLGETEAAILGGAQTAYEAAARLRWTRRARALADLDPFNQMLAVTETAAHLQLLAAQGRVTRHEAGGLRYYLPA